MSASPQTFSQPSLLFQDSIWLPTSWPWEFQHESKSSDWEVPLMRASQPINLHLQFALAMGSLSNDFEDTVKITF